MLDTINNDKYYSPEELAKKFKLSLSSIYKLVRSGEIPSIRLGKIYRIPESDLNRFLTAQKSAKPVVSKIPGTAQKFLDLIKSSTLRQRIQEVYLYGSHARGDFNTESDIDLCVVIDRLDIKTRNQISSLAERAMAATEYQELLSVREEGAESWARMKRENYPLVQNILREGIPLWKNH